MKKADIIKNTHLFVKDFFVNDASGHDYWHSYRVWRNSKIITKSEKADGLIVELAALLHDVADRKFTGGDKSRGVRIISEFLHSCGVNKNIIKHVSLIVSNMSYSDSFDNGKRISRLTTIEGKVVQDADRLDALGAVGIARAFAYGGSKGRAIFNPTVTPALHRNRSEYISKTSHTINHFYEKLLLLKDLMNTKTGKEIASSRHAFMLKYLKQFYSEWVGKS